MSGHHPWPPPSAERLAAEARVCERCWRRRPISDVAFIDEKPYCHPAESSGTTCYMLASAEAPAGERSVYDPASPDHHLVTGEAPAGEGAPNEAIMWQRLYEAEKAKLASLKEERDEVGRIRSVVDGFFAVWGSGSQDEWEAYREDIAQVYPLLDSLRTQLASLKEERDRAWNIADANAKVATEAQDQLTEARAALDRTSDMANGLAAQLAEAQKERDDYKALARLPDAWMDLRAELTAQLTEARAALREIADPDQTYEGGDPAMPLPSDIARSALTPPETETTEARCYVCGRREGETHNDTDHKHGNSGPPWYRVSPQTETTEET